MASIFSRFADIINSNINSMLDKAQNPKKMLKLIINEMEDTLIEIKSSCAHVMAEQSRNSRELNIFLSQEELWHKRAELAISKNRDDLAREALVEKKIVADAVTILQEENDELDLLIEKYKTEIEQLEQKISSAREREQLLVLKEKKAKETLKGRKQIKKCTLTEAQLRLNELDNRIDKIEAEANVELFGTMPRSENVTREESLENEFKKLDDGIEKELELLKNNLKPN